MIRSATVALALSALGSTTAFAHGFGRGHGPAPAVRPTDFNAPFQRLDNQLSVRVGMGLGFATLSGRDDSESSVGFDMNATVGWAVLPQLVLHAGIGGGYIPSFMEWGNYSVSLSHLFLGAGATYYFLPHDIYLMGQIGWGELSANENVWDTSASTDGFAFNFGLGKEWWVSNELTVGVGFNGLYMALEGDASYFVAGLHFILGINP